MGVDKLVGLRFHGIFYTGFIRQFHHKLVYKGSVGLFITRIVRVITNWDKVFLKLEVNFDGLVSRKKVFLDSIHLI